MRGLFLLVLALPACAEDGGAATPPPGEVVVINETRCALRVERQVPFERVDLSSGDTLTLTVDGCVPLLLQPNECGANRSETGCGRPGDACVLRVFEVSATEIDVAATESCSTENPDIIINPDL